MYTGTYIGVIEGELRTPSARTTVLGAKLADPFGVLSSLSSYGAARSFRYSYSAAQDRRKALFVPLFMLLDEGSEL